jgi:uncharacterized membrane protein YoaK (UPF0700 family)
VFLGLALGGAPGLSITRTILAVLVFLCGAAVGGRMTLRGASAVHAFATEAVLLLMAATVAIGLTPPYQDHEGKIYRIVALTAAAMGMRNVVVRKLGVADLTTTVLTMTIAGLAADSVLAGGDNIRWQRRCAAILMMVGGAAVGVVMLNHSVALPLFVCAGITGGCGVAWYRS